MSRRTHLGVAALGLALAAWSAVPGEQLVGERPAAPAPSPDVTVADEGTAVTADDAVHCALPDGERADSSTLHRIDSQGVERSFILRLPEGYEQQESWPLIVAYHGRGSTGPEVEGYSELSRLPAVIAYPNGEIGTGDGYRKAWQGAPYEPPGVDDVAFTEDLLEEVESTYCIDQRRVYATGKSNGAGLVALLACRLPDRFAAVAPVAGAYYPGTREGCADAPPVPVLNIHGTGDATIPYAGDPDRDLPAITDWVAERVERNGCRGRPVVRTTGPDITTTTWRGCRAGASVAHVAVTEGGHVWPGADVYSGGGYVSRTIESSEVMWDFFSQHRLTVDPGTEPTTAGGTR